MRRRAALIAYVVGALGALAWRAAPGQEGGAPDAAPVREVQDVAPEGLQFIAIDVYVDSGERELGAWQVEVTSDSPEAKLVGVEGGAHAAYAEPPYYDPAALHESDAFDRVVIAALSTADELPTGRTRVARLHFMVEGEPGFRVKLMAAGARDATPIGAGVFFEQTTTGTVEGGA